jgi:hypothetical protein
MSTAWKIKIGIIWEQLPGPWRKIVWGLLACLLSIVVGVPLRQFAFLIWLWVTAATFTAERWRKGVAGKPFSFCLPGYRESLRKSSFLLALGLGLLAAPLGLIFRWQETLGHEGPTATGVYLHLAGGFLVGVAASLCQNVDIRFIVSRIVWAFFLLLSIPFFIVGVIAVPLGFLFPAFGIPVSLAVCAFMWIGLGDARRIRRGHRMIVEDGLDSRIQAGVTKTVSPRVARLFQRLIERRRQFDDWHYVWGSLYRTFGLAFSYWVWIMASVVGSALVLGYAGAWFAAVAFAASGLLAVGVHLPVGFDGLLLPAGRRERYHETLAVAVASSLLLIGFAGAVAVCSRVFSLFLSAGQDSAYVGIRAGTIYLSCLLVPWVLGWRLLGYKWPSSSFLTAPVAGLCLMVAVYYRVAGIGSFKLVATVLLATVIVAGWPFFLWTLRDVCKRASLIRGRCAEETMP